MKFSNRFLELLEEISLFEQSYNATDTWYRGQSQDWPLHSGLFRKNNIKNLKQLKTREQTIYRSFLSLGHPYLKNERDWELLFIMQHHGVRTRLLDWSPSLMTALYFAAADPVSPVLWMLKPESLNYMNLANPGILTFPVTPRYEDLLSDSKNNFLTAAIQPVRNSARQIIQQGMFTIQGDSENDVPLELEWGGEILEKGMLKKINLPIDLIDEIQYFLRLNNIDYFTIFPDLDGLSKSLNERFFT